MQYHRPYHRDPARLQGQNDGQKLSDKRRHGRDPVPVKRVLPDGAAVKLYGKAGKCHSGYALVQTDRSGDRGAHGGEQGNKRQHLQI